jgi:hypothetical protein
MADRLLCGIYCHPLLCSLFLLSAVLHFQDAHKCSQWSGGRSIVCSNFWPCFLGYASFLLSLSKIDLTHQFLWKGFCVTLMFVGCFPNLPHKRSLSILLRLFGVSLLQGYLYFTRYHDRPWLRCLVSEISSNVKSYRLPPRPLACCEYALSETRSTLIVSLALSIVYR